jgi:Fe2+ or Zn2+ uptake regulation protein
MDTTTARTVIPQLLARRGRRLTGPRRAILDAVSAGESPLTVAEIHANLSRAGVNRVTVYRTIHLLVAEGLLRVVDPPQGPARYGLDEQFTGHRYLLICRRCGRVEPSAGCPVTDEVMARLRQQARRARQFRATDHELRLLGVCRRCHG